MKKTAKRIAFFLIASVLVTSVSVGASTPIGGVTKVNYQFIVNGKKLELPSYLTVMNKDNATYVPVRFLSENMGLDVEYKPGTVIINSNSFDQNIESSSNKLQELENQVEKLGKENNQLKEQVDAMKNTVFYKKLPVVFDSGNGLKITLLNIAKGSDGVELFVEFSNSSPERYFVVDPFKTKVIANKKEYNANRKTDAGLNTTLNSAADKYSPTTRQGIIYIDDIDSSEVTGNISFSYNDNGENIQKAYIFFDNTK